MTTDTDKDESLRLAGSLVAIAIREKRRTYPSPDFPPAVGTVIKLGNRHYRVGKQGYRDLDDFWATWVNAGEPMMACDETGRDLSAIELINMETGKPEHVPTFFVYESGWSGETCSTCWGRNHTGNPCTVLCPGFRDDTPDFSTRY